MKGEEGLSAFRLEYRADVLLRNRPDSRFGVRGSAKNRLSVKADGEVFLDFASDLFFRPAERFFDAERAGELLRALDGFLVSRPASVLPPPPYLDYVACYALFLRPDGRTKLVLDDLNDGDRCALKYIVDNFLRAYGLRLDIGEPLPSGICRYVQVRTEKSEKEYSYFYAGGEISPGDRVIVPFGAENEETEAVVTSVEYYREGDVPFPVGRVKFIRRLSGGKGR